MQQQQNKVAARGTEKTAGEEEETTRQWPRASAAVWAAMAIVVPVAAGGKAAPEAGTGAPYNISREGGKDLNRNRVHCQREAATCATWAAAEVVAAKT
jgi:hypothetical protein